MDRVYEHESKKKTCGQNIDQIADLVYENIKQLIQTYLRTGTKKGRLKTNKENYTLKERQ